MKILVTGSKGFIGKNLVESLQNIADGKDRREKYSALLPLTIYEFDKNCTEEDLDSYCEDCDFVFNLAGVNRPQDDSEYIAGNVGFADLLLSKLEEHGNNCPVMLASSIQASLRGKYSGSKYGESKLQGENHLREYSRRTGAPILIYRFPNVYGKWCKPNYNSVIATFCHNLANNIPIRIDDERTILELLYIDDLISSLLEQACIPHERGEGSEEIFEAGPTDIITLGEIVSLLKSFRSSRKTLYVPNLEEGSFSKKLYSTYQSYVDPHDLSYSLNSKVDSRGAFTEFLKTSNMGQVSVNVIAPNETKGNHWHHSKWEKFLVVSGDGIIRQRKIGYTSEGELYPVTEYFVNGNDPVVVETPPGFTHSITNESNTNDLVTIIWCNEVFDFANPDTYYEEV